MNCCCSKILKLCKTPVCVGTEIEIPSYEAATEGIYTLQLNFLNGLITLNSKLAMEGEKLVFKLSGLNESYTFTGVILNPDFEKISIPDPEATDDNPLPDYDCISFETTPQQQITQQYES